MWIWGHIYGIKWHEKGVMKHVKSLKMCHFWGTPKKVVKNGVLPLFGKSVILCILRNAQNVKGRCLMNRCGKRWKKHVCLLSKQTCFVHTCTIAHGHHFWPLFDGFWCPKMTWKSVIKCVILCAILCVTYDHILRSCYMRIYGECVYI